MKIKFLLIGAIALLLVLIIGGVSCTNIAPGHVGIRVNKLGGDKGVQDFPAQAAGYYFVNPFTTTFFEFPTFMQNYVYTASKQEGKAVNEEITFQTKDSVNVSADVSVGYFLKPEDVPKFYVKFRSDDISQFTHGYLRNTSRDAFQKIASEFTFDEINGPKKEDFLNKVKLTLNNDVNRFGVYVEQFGFVGAPRPPQTMIAAINAKVEAIQKAVQAENELRQAKAEAAKKVAEAEGAALSNYKVAEGNALSNERLARSITPQLMEWQRLQVQIKQAERWDGKLPTTMVPGSTVPFISVK